MVRPTNARNKYWQCSRPALSGRADSPETATERRGYSQDCLAKLMRSAKRRTLSVALIGTKFMGRAHSNAWRQAPRFFDLPVEIRMAAICGRDRAATRRAAKMLGWEKPVSDWKTIVADPAIDIVDICTPNDSHAEIAIAAARAGKAILCEKPLARNLAEARRMVEAVKRARIVNMVCHNYRRVPAILLAKQMIDAGEIGERIYHFRARYAQDWIADEKFPSLPRDRQFRRRGIAPDQ